MKEMHDDELRKVFRSQFEKKEPVPEFEEVWPTGPRAGRTILRRSLLTAATVSMLVVVAYFLWHPDDVATDVVSISKWSAPTENLIPSSEKNMIMQLQKWESPTAFLIPENDNNNENLN